MQILQNPSFRFIHEIWRAELLGCTGIAQEEKSEPIDAYVGSQNRPLGAGVDMNSMDLRGMKRTSWQLTNPFCIGFRVLSIKCPL